ncbi:hypothetical protein A8C56_17310 [Niabella ginsenosidivorans]|uniref:DUF3298 domain-containing protein n=1 Tax=Niabella ginsenosidivorans TaxID=1176587 RepID=A0A1A9I7I3_9BACT|nr:DUF3298 and DUF4163 domain-containing protein [Niabella ginsenosidivorans]ANH82494.1 hypothetical protein A8C56_17310 [Niabella ginsenosidivorans]
MKKIFLFFSILLLALYSCKNKDEKKEAPTAADNAQETRDKENFYAQYEGTIGNMPVIMHVVKYGTAYNINYSYTDHGKTIELLFQKDSLLKNDSLSFTEFADRGLTNGEQKEAQLHMLISSKAISGYWIGGDKTTSLPVSLKPQTGYAAFTPLVYTDSVKITGFKTDTPSAYTSLVLLQPSDTGLNGDWFSSVIKKEVIGELQPDPATPLQYSIKRLGSNFLQDFKEDIDTLKAAGNDTGHIPYSLMHYDQQLITNLIYNDKGYAVLNSSNYVYTGGAHGMYNETFYCFDLKQQKRLTRESILNIDSAQLVPLLEKYFRISYKLGPDKPLKEILFDNQLTLTNNFYFTSKGIGFLYQPYEIAAYAVGPVDIWIPYAELKPYINPEFAQRMGI